jgi:nitrite reductase/ring-hydroxylating ferredoxin subunit
MLDIGRWGIGVFNVGGRFYALNNYCPHMGAPVCRGIVKGTVEADATYRVRWVRAGEILRCPWHGWEFEIETGVTIAGPARRISTYPVTIEDGKVVVETKD